MPRLDCQSVSAETARLIDVLNQAQAEEVALHVRAAQSKITEGGEVPVVRIDRREPLYWYWKPCCKNQCESRL